MNITLNINLTGGSACSKCDHSVCSGLDIALAFGGGLTAACALFMGMAAVMAAGDLVHAAMAALYLSIAAGGMYALYRRQAGVINVALLFFLLLAGIVGAVTSLAAIGDGFEHGAALAGIAKAAVLAGIAALSLLAFRQILRSKNY